MAHILWNRERPWRWSGVAAMEWLLAGKDRLAQLLGDWKDGDDLTPVDIADPELVALLQLVATLMTDSRNP